MDQLKIATFAGGCFWCTESGFRALTGVIDVVSGYSGGELAHPSYEQVCSGQSGHLEAVQVHYDCQLISYRQLVEGFWRLIDPTDAGGQFADRGPQYRSAILVQNLDEREEAEASRLALQQSQRFDSPIVTEVLPFKNFYPAEDYHQQFSCKNPQRYQSYSTHSGRVGFLHRYWQLESIP